MNRTGNLTLGGLPLSGGVGGLRRAAAVVNVGGKVTICNCTISGNSGEGINSAGYAAASGTITTCRNIPGTGISSTVSGNGDVGIAGATRPASLFIGDSTVSGEAAQALAGRAPRPYLIVDPRDAVKWALYYPPLIDPQAIAADSMPGTSRNAVRRYYQGDVAQALTVLTSVPQTRRNAAYYNLETALLLSVGRVEEARTSIAAAREIGASPASTLAFEAIIALAQNRKHWARSCRTGRSTGT